MSENSCQCVFVECLEDETIDIDCIEDQVFDIHTPIRDYLYVYETFDWLVFTIEDWEVVGDAYRLVVPIGKHKCTNPYVASMVIASSNNSIKYNANLPTWYVLSNDSVVITSDEPIACKILIKGER